MAGAGRPGGVHSGGGTRSRQRGGKSVTVAAQSSGEKVGK